MALACALVQLANVQVTVLEGRPAKSCKVRGRSHTIGLGRRAREALIRIGGEALWERVRSRGMYAGGFTLNLNGFPLSLPSPEGEPVALVDRGDITAAIREHLVSSNCAPGTDVHIEHSTRVSSVDFARRTVVLERDGQKAETISYDLLVGADGVRSRVRGAMNSQLPPGHFESELRLMPGRWQVLHMDLPDDFQRDGVHALVNSEAPFGLFCIPNDEGPHCVIVSWSSEETPTELLSARTPEELEATLLTYFPKIGSIPQEALESFLEAQASKSVVSRCRPLHNADSSVCLLGDAAHAVGGGSLGQGCSAALQDAAALGEALSAGSKLTDRLREERSQQQQQPEPAGEGVLQWRWAPGVQDIHHQFVDGADGQEWAEGSEEALASSLAAYSEQRAEEGWALLDLIELQSAAEVRAGALLQGPVVFGFFIEQLGRGTLKPLAEIGARLLSNRLEINERTSQEEVSEFVTHLKMQPTMKFTPGVLAFLLERAVLGTWKLVLDTLTGLAPPMQTALMATDESYSQLVKRNSAWLALLQSAKAAAGVSRISSIQEIHALRSLADPQRAAWAQCFQAQEQLKDDVIVRQSSSANTFFAIRAGTCRVLRNGLEVATLGPGDTFGEVALLLGVPSPVSIVAETDTTLLQMPGDDFLNLVKQADPELITALTERAEEYGAGLMSVQAAQQEGRDRVRVLLADKGLYIDPHDYARSAIGADGEHGDQGRPGTSGPMEGLNIDELLGTVGCETYAAGELVALGCQRMRIIEQGECSVVRSGRAIRVLRAGDFFGPDLAAEERVVARSEKVNVCSFTPEASPELLARLRTTSVVEQLASA